MFLRREGRQPGFRPAHGRRLGEYFHRATCEDSQTERGDGGTARADSAREHPAGREGPTSGKRAGRLVTPRERGGAAGGGSGSGVVDTCFLKVQLFSFFPR